LSVYRLPSAYERSPLRRRLSGLALALGINLALLLLLLTLGRTAPDLKPISHALVIDFLPEAHSAKTEVQHQAAKRPETKPLPKPPPVVLPVKPTIAAPPPAPPAQPKPAPFIEMSSADLAAADLRNVPTASAGDSAVVGKGPHGEVLYAAEWARHPTDAELGGYLPKNAPDGSGVIACKTIPGDRVEDCVEIANYPAGSHLASAVRQAAWQFRIRPPRINGRPLIGSWVQIEIDYQTVRRNSSSGL
jgi:protein TonB